MKQKENQKELELDIDIYKIINFFIANGKLILFFMISSAALNSLLTRYTGETSEIVEGTSIIKISSVHRAPSYKGPSVSGVLSRFNIDSEQPKSIMIQTSKDPVYRNGVRKTHYAGIFDYTKLNILRSTIPGYISLIIESNANSITKNNVDNVNKKDLGKVKESFKKENFNALHQLKNNTWLENNLKGSNGRFVVGKSNSIPIRPDTLFGKDYIYEPYEDIVITARGDNKQYVKAVLENTQTALGRVMQYNFTQQWITENIDSFEAEKFDTKHMLARYEEDNRILNLQIDFLKDSISKHPKGTLSLKLLSELYQDVPEALLPIDVRIFQLRNMIEGNTIKSDLRIKRLELIELEEKLFTRYKSFFDNNFSKLTSPNINELSNYVQDQLDNTLEEEKQERAVLTAHLRDLKLAELMPKVFTQDPYVNYTFTSLSGAKRQIWGLMIGLFAALLFIFIRLMLKETKEKRKQTKK